MKNKVCKVIKPYLSAYPNPIKIKMGELVTINDKKSEWPGWTWCTDKNGKSGWIPDCYVRKEGSKSIALLDYEATELTVETGEILKIKKEECGWFWCINQRGVEGWIPSENVKTILMSFRPKAKP